MARSIWIARHAERLDTVDLDWKPRAKYPHDTPLSEQGHKQAIQMALSLKDKNIKHIICSPFLRTVQTAQYCAGVLGLKINIEPGLHEWINIPDRVEIEGFTPILDTEGFYEPLWNRKIQRESESDMYRRMEAIGKALMMRFEGNLLLISHGSPVKALIEKLSGVPNIPMPGLSSLYCVEDK